MILQIQGIKGVTTMRGIATEAEIKIKIEVTEKSTTEKMETREMVDDQVVNQIEIAPHGEDDLTRQSLRNAVDETLRNEHTEDITETALEEMRDL
ncbi:hypothetical protein MMC20_004218 [Loxospora ochrophaea]|nr:hypothetical protein [Loxospora ochrophaea]